jgi:hypothetical protein
LSLADIPLSSSPVWTSSDPSYGTGGAFGDVDGDGWLDLATGDGNDMAWDRNKVYRNQNGSLETAASWTSADTGQFSHVSLGDVDGDGDLDMAVSFLGLGSIIGPSRIYLNLGDTLGRQPWWTSADSYNSFDCDFGDYDNDGDLDLAVAAGDAYYGTKSPARVYENSGGSLGTMPAWTSADSTPGDAARWCDIDDDGRLDLVYGQRGRVSVFRNGAGGLEASASQVLTQGVGWVLRLSLDDIDGDGDPDLALASNGQIGDPNSFRIFRNNDGAFDTLACWTAGSTDDYSSCVSFGDADGDAWPDLAVGGWWEPVRVYRNDAGNLGASPEWTWSNGNQVVESLVWGDVDGSHVVEASDTVSGDGWRTLWRLARRPLHSFVRASVGGAALPDTDFCYGLLGGWVSLKQAPPPGSGNVILRYRYSKAPDLAMIDWAGSNRLFGNTTPSGVSGREPLTATPGPSLSVRPNPCRAWATVELEAGAPGPVSVSIFDVTGRMVHRHIRQAGGPGRQAFIWHPRGAAAGVYLVRAETTRGAQTARLVLVK